MKAPIFIAEIKTQSPFGFKTDESFYRLMQRAVKFGDWISVHTSPLYGGSMDAISFVRRYTGKPILAKGFHYTDDEIRKAFDHGADYVLVVDRIPSYGTGIGKCLIELSNTNFMLDVMTRLPHLKYVYNTRDILNGQPRQNRLDDCIKVAAERKTWLCQASNIGHPNHVDPRVQACIVGENLPAFCGVLNQNEKLFQYLTKFVKERKTA